VKYGLNCHAFVRIQERKIDCAWFGTSNPVSGETEPDHENPALEHRRAAIAEQDSRSIPHDYDFLKARHGHPILSPDPKNFALACVANCAAVYNMCRAITAPHNFSPPATNDEIRNSFES